MRLLLTNDDGFNAPGLKTLYQVLAADGRHEICIVAPDTQRSATGRSITVFEPLFLTRCPLLNGDSGFLINGTPTDCAKLALQGDILPFWPDLAISGINHGPNLGNDVFYSGTVAAAMECAMLGVNAIAVSLATHGQIGEPDFFPAATFLCNVLLHDPVLSAYPGLLNINFPATPAETWGELEVTRLGKSVYMNSFENRTTPFGREYYWIKGAVVKEEAEGTDQEAISKNRIAVTPLRGDLTDYAELENLKRKLKESPTFEPAKGKTTL